MDTVGAREELSSIDWEKVLEGTVNESWESLKDILFRIQSKYVPHKAKGGKKKLWMSYKALKYVKRKHKVFKKYKDTKHPACRRAANKASNELKKAKFNFKKKLADNIKNDSKSFYAYVRGGSRATKKVGPTVNSQGELDDSNEGMCELLNQAFGEVFTRT